jgi:hypothetical protein
MTDFLHSTVANIAIYKHLLIFLGIYAACLTVGWTGFLLERKRWNGGCCSKHALAWVRFDTDSQGGRMYKCPTTPDSCGTDASWPVDSENAMARMIRLSLWFALGCLAIQAFCLLVVGASR